MKSILITKPINYYSKNSEESRLPKKSVKNSDFLSRKSRNSKKLSSEMSHWIEKSEMKEEIRLLILSKMEIRSDLINSLKKTH